MKALSVKQPWAQLLASGIKDIENRTWRTNYRGWVLIHASQKPVPDGWKALSFEQTDVLTKLREKKKLPKGFSFREVRFSSIIGVTKLVDCVQNHPSVWAEHGEGIWHWVFAEARLFANPIPNVNGRLGFWDFDGWDIEDRHCDECDFFCECGNIGHNGYDKACADFCEDVMKTLENE